MSEPRLQLASTGAGIRLRIVSAAILMPISLLFVAAGGWHLAVLAMCLGVAMAWELGRQISPRHSYLLTAHGALTIAAAIALAFAAKPLVAGAVLGAGALAAFLLTLMLGPTRHAPLAGIWLAYVGAAGLALMSLRAGEAGAWVVAWLLLLVWTADTVAFLAGTQVGRHALWPEVSPDKTWEGLVAAMSCGAAIGLLLAPRLPGLGPFDAAFLSAGLAVVAQIGDLAESALKRRLGVKDMSGLIPGHGGVLDRLDSVLPVLIIAAIGEGVWSL